MTAMPARPRARKNDSAAETARVMRVFDMLVDELGIRNPAQPYMASFDGSRGTYDHNYTFDLLAIADRIASRTEDPA